MLRQLFRRRPPELQGPQEATPLPSEPDHQEGELDVKDLTKKGRGRGFGGMSEARRKEIAANGGRKAQANQTAHQWTREEASAAGKKSGIARREKKAS